MKKRIGEMVLVITYVAMLGVCIFLNATSDQGNDSASLIINVAMFAIVGGIFAWTIRNSFQKVNRIAVELETATMKIKSDYENEQKYLWDKYVSDTEASLFKQGELAGAYQEYLAEMKRLEAVSASGYRCSIEDYINQELIDTRAKKNLLNLIPGAMTGMGILGTFIGLSLGLQNFNTGTSAEIEDSIAPLMNGIKVAFHTSIYGMVFSLVFNFVYKNILEATYKNLDEFLDAYSLYVCPDAENDSFSKLIDSQQKQSETVVNPLLAAVQTMNDNLTTMLEIQREQRVELKNMPTIMTEAVTKAIDEIITPQFVRTNENLESFASKISETQLSGMGDLIDRFVSQMNESLADSFANLAKIIDETCELQKQNSDYMQDILARVGNMALEIQQINELSAKTIESLSNYIQEIENLQSIINQNFMSVNLQLEQNNKMEEKQQTYIATLVEYERQIGEASEKFSHDMSGQIELLAKLEKEISESTKENLDILTSKANEYNNSLADMAQKQLQAITGLADTFRRKISEEIEQVNQQARTRNDQLADTTKQHMQNVLTLTTEFKDNLAKQIDLVAKQAEVQNTAIADAAKKEIQSILTLSSSTTSDMDRAAQELGAVSKQLNGQLQQSLQTTFDIFDQELADITKHLSGTIAEVDSTTGRVPKVVASAYEDMGKSFEEMQKQMQSMIHMLDIMQRNMPAIKEKPSRNK